MHRAEHIADAPSLPGCSLLSLVRSYILSPLPPAARQAGALLQTLLAAAMVGGVGMAAAC